MVEHWIIDPAARVRFTPKSWEFFQPNLLCFVLCYGFHVVRVMSCEKRPKAMCVHSNAWEIALNIWGLNWRLLTFCKINTLFKQKGQILISPRWYYGSSDRTFFLATSVLRWWMDGWLAIFTSFSTVFQSYQDDGLMIMKGCVQWNPIYGWAYFASSGARSRDRWFSRSALNLLSYRDSTPVKHKG